MTCCKRSWRSLSIRELPRAYGRSDRRVLRGQKVTKTVRLAEANSSPTHVERGARLDSFGTAPRLGHQFNPTIRPDLQVRQRRGQQFQQHKDSTRDHAATDKSDRATSRIWWPYSTSWSSSSTLWWSSTGCQEW